MTILEEMFLKDPNINEKGGESKFSAGGDLHIFCCPRDLGALASAFRLREGLIASPHASHLMLDHAMMLTSWVHQLVDHWVPGSQ